MFDLLAEAESDRLAGFYPIFGNLGAGLRTTLRSDLRSIHAPARRMLFDLVSACSRLLLLAGGSIRIVKPAVSGCERLLDRLQPGDSCSLTCADCLPYQLPGAQARRARRDGLRQLGTALSPVIGRFGVIPCVCLSLSF